MFSAVVGVEDTCVAEAAIMTTHPRARMVSVKPQARGPKRWGKGRKIWGDVIKRKNKRKTHRPLDQSNERKGLKFQLADHAYIEMCTTVIEHVLQSTFRSPVDKSKTEKLYDV